MKIVEVHVTVLTMLNAITSVEGVSAQAVGSESGATNVSLQLFSPSFCLCFTQFNLFVSSFIVFLPSCHSFNLPFLALFIFFLVFLFLSGPRSLFLFSFPLFLFLLLSASLSVLSSSVYLSVLSPSIFFLFISFCVSSIDPSPPQSLSSLSSLFYLPPFLLSGIQ